MSKNLPLISTIMLVALLALVLFSVISLLEGDHQDRLKPKASQGVIDLRTVDFTGSNSIPLGGQWAFYWEQLFSYEQATQNEDSARYVTVPHVWTDLQNEQQQNLKYGYATYKLSVKIADPAVPLALKIPTVGTAFRLFINEKLIVDAGEVAGNKSEAIAQYKPGIYSFVPPAETFDIIVQVSNYDLIWGGLWLDIRMGTPVELHLEQSRKNIKAVFIIATFITIAVFNLIQYSLRTIDPVPLLISLTCLLLAVREVEGTQLLAFIQAYYIPFEISVRISFITFFGCVATISSYYYFTFKKDYKKPIMYSIFGVSGIGCLIVIFAPLSVSSEIVPFFQIFTLLAIAYTSFGLVKAVKKKRPAANFIFLGTLVLFSLIVYDLLINLRILEGVQLVSFGLVSLIMCQNYVTYSQFMIDSDENTRLSEELGLRNEELKAFSKSLEDQVASRTAELSQVNEQLEVFAFNDSLTAALNRRGLLQHAEDAKEAFTSNNTPFCLLLIDFDHFKKLNDTHGHELGDKVLVEGASHMRSVVDNQGYIGRWGGEEFLVLLNQKSIEAATDIAQGIRVTIEELVSTKVGTPVTVSVGVSQYTAGEAIEKTIKHADDALYKAKSAGRNCVKIARAEPANEESLT